MGDELGGRCPPGMGGAMRIEFCSRSRGVSAADRSCAVLADPGANVDKWTE